MTGHSSHSLFLPQLRSFRGQEAAGSAPSPTTEHSCKIKLVTKAAILSSDSLHSEGLGILHSITQVWEWPALEK